MRSRSGLHHNEVRGRAGAVSCGSDMLWINDCLGLGGFTGRFKCSWCECDGEHLENSRRNRLAAPTAGTKAIAHVTPPDEEHPFECPACKELVTDRGSNTARNKSSWAQSPQNGHAGQNKGCAPIFLITRF
jgi:hypothetical protein